MSAGKSALAVVPAGVPVDIAGSLAPFMTIYDDSGVPIASSGHLDGALPRLPQGVLDYARAHGENRVTWQPLTGVRVAAVVTRYSGQASGFVLAGRSLRENPAVARDEARGLPRDRAHPRRRNDGDVVG